MLGTKEFYDLRDQFEKDGKCLYRIDFDRSNSGIKGDFYNHGETNEMFRAYMMGYQYGKVANRND